MLEGLAFLRTRQVLLMTFVVDLVAMVFAMPRALFPALAEQVYGGGAQTAGLLYSALAAGALGGALFSGWFRRVHRHGVAVVVAIGVQLLRVLSLSGLFVAVALTYTGGLQGTGDTKSPLYISIVSQIVVPLGTCFFIKQFGTLDPIDIWIAILLGHAFRCGLSVLRFNEGKWRRIVVDIDSKART
ncbi:MAG: polysaccharide biosynthesis C-terminal domain-containing protein [Gemmatimonadetes bacterium]|nr:polysaccharide biosynthesis C-terminal domain-containing protein [Gemmatimonadota bacterium]